MTCGQLEREASDCTRVGLGFVYVIWVYFSDTRNDRIRQAWVVFFGWRRDTCVCWWIRRTFMKWMCLFYQLSFWHDIFYDALDRRKIIQHTSLHPILIRSCCQHRLLILRLFVHAQKQPEGLNSRACVLPTLMTQWHRWRSQLVRPIYPERTVDYTVQLSELHMLPRKLRK